MRSKERRTSTTVATADSPSLLFSFSLLLFLRSSSHSPASLSSPRVRPERLCVGPHARRRARLDLCRRVRPAFRIPRLLLRRGDVERCAAGKRHRDEVGREARDGGFARGLVEGPVVGGRGGHGFRSGASIEGRRKQKRDQRKKKRQRLDSEHRTDVDRLRT